ncbi:MAG: hypothetical protein C0201_01190 [Caldisphaera sp.]|nr:MAG: hypothetical protein C0201_01190 [Caldisphaera sp.]
MYNRLIDKIINHLDKGTYELLDIDGYRIDIKDGSWILIRPSGTENKIRFYMQSYSKERLKELLDLAEFLLKSSAIEMGIKLGNLKKYVELGRS